jgi:hypothetical protein
MRDIAFIDPQLRLSSSDMVRTGIISISRQFVLPLNILFWNAAFVPPLFLIVPSYPYFHSAILMSVPIC